ncbi:hypothetical protein B5X24_HaOG214049 [Helicoverpa armigera]|uniref:Srp40 C-terminal domain-containing protein n=1 Tax=Helicoverpa armigera TaxID=29058 RepID=A0A2W1B3N4_HELAM|nr:hypothetical protein B5X24_HaOG214049 [Helicoverpa armigera]
MLILCRFNIIGLQLLLLTHIAHSFVLLTANVEDVKKLARKFVSDSLADKIAEFIAKAAQNMGANVSEEKEPKADQVSEENDQYNIERHGESGAQDAVKSKEESTEKTVEKKEESDSISIEEKSKEIETTAETTTTQIQQEEQSRYLQLEPKLNQPSLEPEKKSKLSEEDDKFDKSKEASKYLEENLVTKSTTNSEPSKALEPLKPKKAKKGRPYRLLANLNSIEENDMNAKLTENNDTLDDFSENLLFNQKRSFDGHRNFGGVKLTTSKGAYEFDQYDTKRIKNNGLAATNGPATVVLPGDKVSDNWWEKDLPGRLHDEKGNIESKRKSWF